MMTHRRIGEIVVVQPQEQRLDARNAADFRLQFTDLLADGHNSIVLSLRNVSFIDSCGLGAIVSVLKAVGRTGDIIICDAQDSVGDLFKLTRMDRLLRVLAGEQEAIAQLRH